MKNKDVFGKDELNPTHQISLFLRYMNHFAKGTVGFFVQNLEVDLVVMQRTIAVFALDY